MQSSYKGVRIQALKTSPSEVTSRGELVLVRVPSAVMALFKVSCRTELIDEKELTQYSTLDKTHGGISIYTHACSRSKWNVQLVC